MIYTGKHSKSFSHLQLAVMIFCLTFLTAAAFFSLTGAAAQTKLSAQADSASSAESETSDNGGNPYAAVRVSGGKSILYNPEDGTVWKGLTGVRQVPSGSGFYYYFKKNNGQVYAGGFFTVKNKTRYADSDGHLLTGFQKVGKYYYYFGAKGVLKKNGIINAGGKVRYYADKNGRLKSGLRKINGKYYYFAKDTRRMQFGWITAGGNTYFMSRSAEMLGQARTGWFRRNGLRYYFDSKGRMVHGWQVISGSRYYFDPDTGVMFTGTHVIGGSTYVFASNGKLNINSLTGAWYIRVNQGTNTVTIYRGEIAVKAFACSVGLNGATPTGNFTILDKLRWHELMGPSWGQWCSHITSDILFHSIPYNSFQNNMSMSTTAYNSLGRAASHGCIRLAARDAKYIYDNCPVGTRVNIFYGTSKDDPLGKPMPPYVGSWTRTYDPTDPNI